MKNSSHIIGNRTRDLLACSAVPQPTAPPRAHVFIFYLSPPNVSSAVKIMLYKTMAKPAVVYGSETWAMVEMDRKRLGTWDSILLRRIYGPVAEQGIWKVRAN